MELSNNDVAGLSRTPASVVNGGESRQPVHRRPVGLTITVKRLGRALADIQARIETLRREKVNLGLVRRELVRVVPRHWPGYSMRFRYHSAVYDITVENPHQVNRGVTLAELDGMPLISRDHIPLANDGNHHIRVVLG